jgi:hypothetical protein
MPRRRANALNRTMPVEPPSSMPPGGAQFPPTLWSVVLLAGQSPSLAIGAGIGDVVPRLLVSASTLSFDARATVRTMPRT